MGHLVNDLIRSDYLKTDRIINAFNVIDRSLFLPDDLASVAEADRPLPIGYGQTISQPLTVAFMLELLQPEEGQVVMDIGSGSGWTSALLAAIVGRNGKVIAIERMPELYDYGKGNIKKIKSISSDTVEMYCQDGTKGFPKHAPYDRILVSAAAAEIVPEELKKQLKEGGKMVIPVANSVWLIERKSKDEYAEIEHPGFIFVPLIGDNK